MVSDHTPLLLTCKGLQQRKSRLRLKSFWFKYERPRLMVQQLWGPNGNQTHGSLKSFHLKSKILHRALRIWHQQAFGIMERELEDYRNQILTLDKVEENSPLTGHDFQLRQRLRERAFELASNIEA